MDFARHDVALTLSPDMVRGEGWVRGRRINAYRAKIRLATVSPKRALGGERSLRVLGNRPWTCRAGVLPARPLSLALSPKRGSGERGTVGVARCARDVLT